MAEPEHGPDLADRLKELRERSWPASVLTQNQLGTIFGVSGATISAWESTTNPKRPTTARLEAYARFFATRRSLDDEPHLVPAADLTAEEHNRYDELNAELRGLLSPTGTAASDTGRIEIAGTSALGHTFDFDEGPITVICPQAPSDAQGPLALATDPNFTRLQQYGDLDALIEMYGHLRAVNPTLDVFHHHAGEVGADDLSTHVILLGGVAWNQVTKRFQDAIQQVPVTQIVVEDYTGGDIFEIDGVGQFYPEWDEDDQGNRDLVEDIALLVRLPNPFNGRRTLTICNGVHSRGVFGAVRSLTDRRVREANEQYLAERFPDGRFALLLRVPVVANETMSPDLQNPTGRLYEWPPRSGEHG
jgi:transcriptional regulator with XRE-family HTH domain